MPATDWIDAESLAPVWNQPGVPAELEQQERWRYSQQLKAAPATG